MATTALNVIKRALRLIRVLDRNQPLQSDDRNDALEAFNEMISWLQTNYNHLWTMTQAVILMEQGKASYKCGQGGDRVVDANELSAPTLSAAALAGATSLTVSSATSVTTGDVVGVYLSTGLFQWTSAAADSSGGTITIVDALAADAAVNAQVYVYSDIISRPLRILNAQFGYKYSDSELPLEAWSRDEYFNQPTKTTQGSVSQYYYSQQLTAGEFYVWPTAQSNLSVIRFSYVRPVVTSITNLDAPDFPDEWHETLSYLLAVRLMDEYGLEQDRQAMLKQKADELLAGNLAFDNDGDSMKIELYRYY